MTIIPKVKRGKKGNWWVTLYDEAGTPLFISASPGYDSERAAWDAVGRFRRARWNTFARPAADPAPKPSRPFWRRWL